ncbi:hypothetical protein N007_17765 [Alicyclobacillus acidoterrestris ATCC 49025]|nr:hypothetical protein N007_17765 [Alicyclobacillus acidoterrestris ATCC 49025]
MGATVVTSDEYQQLVAEKKELEKANEQLKKTLGEQTRCGGLSFHILLSRDT